MTFAEAEERAGMLWTDVADVKRLAFDPERWHVIVNVVRLGAGRFSHDHFMDANGHPTCHRECMARESALGVVEP